VVKEDQDRLASIIAFLGMIPRARNSRWREMESARERLARHLLECIILKPKDERVIIDLLQALVEDVN
jgi:hypothetical protein